MQVYVLDKTGKVFEQRPTMTAAHIKDGCSLAVAFDSGKQDENGEPLPYKKGEAIPKDKLLSPDQLIELVKVNMSHVKNVLLRSL